MKTLKIENYNKVITTMYHKDRFICTNAIETDTNYRFQFRDDAAPSTRYIWIEVSRFGHYNIVEDEWEYQLNYPNSPIHVITANWFKRFVNVLKTFDSCLKHTMNI